jgi:ribonuclease-3
MVAIFNHLFRTASQRSFARAIQNLTGIVPNNLRLYQTALTHSSVRNSNAGNDNERMEYLGDAVLDLIAADVLFHQYPYETEGALTEMRARFVNATFLANAAHKMGLDTLLKYDVRNKSLLHRHKNVHADALEALIGAIYLDKGYAQAYRFVQLRIVKLYVDFTELKDVITNHKSKILEWAQKHNKVATFELAEMTEGNYNKKQFVMMLCIDGEAVAKGIDYTKKQAEQIACAAFYNQIVAGGSEDTTA